MPSEQLKSHLADTSNQSPSLHLNKNKTVKNCGFLAIYLSISKSFFRNFKFLLYTKELPLKNHLWVS